MLGIFCYYIVVVRHSFESEYTSLCLVFGCCVILCVEDKQKVLLFCKKKQENTQDSCACWNSVMDAIKVDTVNSRCGYFRLNFFIAAQIAQVA